MTAVWISDLRAHVGETVTVRGWVVTTRSSGKIAFVVLRDGTGTVQGVLSRKEVSDETWTAFGTLTHEASVAMTGAVRDDPRSPGGVELSVTALEPMGPSPDFPITPKEHGTTFLFEHRHLWLRSRRQVALARIRHEVEQAIRDYFYQEGFTLVDTPILTGAIGEEAGNLFATDYFDLGKAYLAQTGQLYVEAAAAALGKVYCFGPTFRAEKSKTRRHLTEFWMVEPEVAFNDSDANMRLQESFVSYIVARVLDRRKEELKELERDTAPLERVQAPFPRISYTDAVSRLNQLGSDMGWGQDLGGDDETLLAKEFDRPVFVFNYPKQVKAFYMKENPADPRTVLNNDCLAPEGYGEIIGGSQREDDYDKLLARIREQGLDPETYRWYLDLRRYGTFVHSGFGLGIERTVAWIAGIPHIREAIAFPRQIHRLYP
jgi:asparaginyl-tRNA synthetase